MKKRLSPAAMFVGGIVAALVVTGGGAVAYAAGGSLLLGHANSASKITSLTSRSTPLELRARNGKASLKIDNKAKVTNLNADAIDGLDSSSFVRTTRISTGYLKAVGTWIDVTGDGIPDTIVAAVDCPRGTLLTGGGTDDFTSAGIPVINGPSDSGKGWIVAEVDDPASGDTGDDVGAYAICMNPVGTVGTGGPAFKSLTTTHPALSASQRQAIINKLR